MRSLAAIGCVLFLLRPAGAVAQGVPAGVETEGVPAIPKALARMVEPYRSVPGAAFGGWYGDRRQMLLVTRSAETTQVFCVLDPGEPWTRITDLRERVVETRPRPGRYQFAFLQDRGGDEAFQIALHDTRARTTRRLTGGAGRNHAPRWSRDGKRLAWSSTARDGRDLDIYVIEPERPHSARMVAEVRGLGVVADWSPDGKRLAVVTADPATGARVIAVDADTGAQEVIAPRPGQPPLAGVGMPHWAADGRSMYGLAAAGSDFIRLVRYDPDGGDPAILTGSIPWDVEEFDLSDDGGTIALVVNEGGASALHLIDAADGRIRRASRVPAGVIENLQFRPGSREFAFHLQTPRSPSEIRSIDLDAGRAVRWTHGPPGGLAFETPASAESVEIKSVDGRPIRAFVYRPERRFEGRRPALIYFHGGPEAQSRPGFLGPLLNFLRNELGIAIILPNVRGSTGYGVAFARLDDGRRRPDVLKDVGAVLDWIAADPGLDAGRVGVMGSSYGGYLALASLIAHGNRLRAGIDECGISNFVTFLEETSAERQDIRRAEYGDERDPAMRAFLTSISPVTHADQIRVPLLVAQGANDTRVPLGEAEQIVAAVRRGGGPVWYVLARNEGHGFVRGSNVLYLHQVQILFLGRYLLGRG